PRVGARTGGAPEGVQGEPRPGSRAEATRGAARDSARRGQPAARDPPGLEGPVFDGRGVRGDARRVRQVRAYVLIDMPGLTSHPPHVRDSACTVSPSAHAPTVCRAACGPARSRTCAATPAGTSCR